MSITKSSTHPKLAKAQKLAQAGKASEALMFLEKLCRKDKRNADAYFLKGSILGKTGDIKAAVLSLKQAIMINPRHALAFFNLGNILICHGELNDAISAYTRALELEPDRADIVNALAKLHAGQGNYRTAIDLYTRYQKQHPGNPDSYGNLATCYFLAGQLDEARKSYEKALKLLQNAAYYDGLGATLCQQGKYKQAINAHLEAVNLNPDCPRFRSNMLLTLNYSTDDNPNYLLQEHKKWDEVQVLTAERVLSYPNETDPDRRLRVGYISPDFRTHSVAYFLEPLFENHSDSVVETFCYACTPHYDDTTKRIQANSDHWRNISGIDDRNAITGIRSDGIDILVDLSGHTAGNRLTVMSGKPAPVQVTWLGYPATTGLSSIDYRITDEIADPADHCDFYSEQLLRLPGCFLCYKPPQDSPPVAPCPFEHNGYTTFGSFNNLAKINENVVQLWSELLNRITNSRILIKNPSLTDKATGNRYIAMFREYGVEEERITLLGLASSTYQHLDTYKCIDIALDTFPYNGTTTTCEALYMGVPVITYTGKYHSGRVSTSILASLGLDQFIAISADNYIAIANKLTDNPCYLSDFRRNMRAYMVKSPMCDGKSFALKIEKAYREIWQTYCSSIPL